ncbi:nucleotide sugar dehydrogenase [Salinarchaeum laminariae]|uniref:nucleotide sugar dehydrogenase n=1 Tax=Salinarchaeum laminariae TaxID=869888 RepID=UPI0020BE90EA
MVVVGLGYVGLPLTVAFDDAGLDVAGFDVDDRRIGTLESGTDPTGDLGDEAIAESGVQFTTDVSALRGTDYVIVAVPTPVDDLENPNLAYVESAGKAIGEQILPRTTVILESTVYPGATREILAPQIEEHSGLTCGDDFYVGYSPERMVPGDDEHGLRDVVKIVSGQNEEVLEDVASLYETIIDAGVHRAPEIEVAEAAKCIENIQRDLNIALVNELAIACNNLGLDTHDVLDAAGTKWNFHDYQPGLVGGHCIPVDPFFMIYEAERNGFTPKLIETGREVNEYMPEHVAELTLRGLNDCGKVLRDSTVLVLGMAYKPGVGDIRSSVVGSTIEKLQSYGVDVVGYDPYAEDDAMREEFGIDVQAKLSFQDVDGVLLATPHESFLEIDYTEAAHRMTDDPLVVDVMGELNGRLAEHEEVTYERV